MYMHCRRRQLTLGTKQPCVRATLSTSPSILQLTVSAKLCITTFVCGVNELWCTAMFCGTAAIFSGPPRLALRLMVSSAGVSA